MGALLPEEIEDAAKEERQEFGRQEVFERRCNHPAGAAEVKCLDETDLERGALFAGGRQAQACDDGLSEK